MSESRMAVISPLGRETVGEQAGAPRLETLAGKTIGEMWNGDFKGDFTFPIIREMLLERFEGLQVVPHTEFPHSTIRGTAAHQRQVDAKMLALAKEKGCDGVIAGNGG